MSEKELNEKIFTPMQVTNIDYVNDYEVSVMQELWTRVILAAGTWVKCLYPARDYCEIVLTRKPVKTGLDMNLTMNPNLKPQASSARTPDITATREAISAYWFALGIIKAPRVDPTSMERVERGPTDN